MDILSDKGYALATYLVLNTKRGGALTLAPVCSTWVFVRSGLIKQEFSFYKNSFTTMNRVWSLTYYPANIIQS